MRLNQFVASASNLSRRGADEAIATGRVKVNGQTGTVGMVVPDGAQVFLDGQIITPPTSYHYVMFNKPPGYVCSRVKQGQSPTIYELLPPELQNLNSIGRLDKDSSGLLLLTDDGIFANLAGHPSAGKTKVYELLLDRAINRADLNLLKQGVELEDGLSRLQARSVDGNRLTVSLEEGRNRQIRRTLEALNYSVKRLHRVAFGKYRLGSLKPGQSQPFEPGLLA